MLRDDQIRRYARHVLLPDVGGRGQARLCAAAARVERAAGAGEVALLYLAAAGVGSLVVPDERPVEAPGLLFEAADVGRPRREAAAERLAALNPDVRVVAAGDGVIVDVPAPIEADDPIAALEQGARAAARAIEKILA